MHARLDEYLNVLTENTRKHFQQHYPSLNLPNYQVVQGRKWSKVIKVDNQRSVHSFVDKDGNVYKPASWHAPAKGVRYNLDQDMDVLRAKADPFGGYLYVR